jgi:hypothetical protein
MKIALICGWILWALLLITWPLNLLFVYANELIDPAVSQSSIPIVALTGLTSIALTFGLRWFLLRFLLQPDRISPDTGWGASLFFFGGFIIWTITKSVELYGFALFFQYSEPTLYLAFWIPSLIVMLLHMPQLLKPKLPLHP